MIKKLSIRTLLAIALLVILYEIWPLPFWYFAKKVILPTGEKVSVGLSYLISPFRFIASISDLDQENKSLQEENKNLTAEVARLNESIHLCSAVNQEVNLSRVTAREMVFAKIIGRTPNTGSQIIVISIGANDGIKEGAAVLSSGYLIGQIKKIDANQSEVRLITSHDSLIPSILEKARETGLTQGGLEGLSLTEVPATTKVSQGDKVLTSGLGGDLPAGILIGKTEAALKERNNLFQSIKISTPVSISSLEVVSVVK